MSFNLSDYVHQLKALLPRGALWESLVADPIFSALLESEAVEFERIDNRATQLIEEIDPRSTIELLPDWEAFAGLPDSCSAAFATTQQERRQALVAKLTYTGGQSRQYFTDLAVSLGYSIDITEYRPFVCGISQCGIDQLWEGGHTVRFHWTVTVNGPRVTYFRCGESECGIDHLMKYVEAEDLECWFQKLKPAQTVLHFNYQP